MESTGKDALARLLEHVFARGCEATIDNAKIIPIVDVDGVIQIVKGCIINLKCASELFCKYVFTHLVESPITPELTSMNLQMLEF